MALAPISPINSCCPHRRLRRCPHLGGIGALRGVALDLAREAEVRHLTDKGFVDERVARSQIAVHVSHVGEVAHAGRNAPHHAHQLDDGELAVVGAQELVERPVLHVLGDDHDGVGLGDHPLQVDDVGVVELAHDGGLGEEVEAVLVGGAGLERLDGHGEVALSGHPQLALTHVAELTWGEKRTKRVSIQHSPGNTIPA